MSNISEPSHEQASSLPRLLNALKQARTQLEDTERQKTEPIAIVGMGFRFPGGVKDPETFWQLLHNGVDAITEIPADRWDVEHYYDPDPDAPGKIYTRHGGFLDQVDQFDPEFFGIAPLEAMDMDPQQRLLLEVTWEALENAGLAPERLKGTQTGLFVGISSDDYAQLSVTFDDLNRLDAYRGLGNARSIAVGRLAYILDLQGLTMQLDSSCSSSLLGIHVACQSLRSGECNLALAGGVNLMLSPINTILGCKLRALSTDGRCKTFDAAADGYVRGEGCGMVVLKRLSDAIADGDNILALIRGSAANHDGKSNGLTAPNGSAQEAVIKQALANARVKPEQIQYVEAHGTGTPLGDPIEVLALGKVLGQGRSEQEPLIIGSLKTNFGHLEAAVGVASLIKVVLSLQHQQIPPHLHFQNPNPYIPWDRLAIAIPTELTPWPRQDGPQLAGVSSFGMSGTNVHIIVEAAPNQLKIQNSKFKIQDHIQECPRHLLTISAKSEQALRDLAQSYESFLSNHATTSIADICFTANTGRSHFHHRLAIVAQTNEHLQQQLNTFLKATPATGVINGQLTSNKRPKIAFLFTGQGSQYVGMGKELYQTQPVFRKYLDQCDQLLSSDLAQPLLEIIYSETSENPLLNQTAYTQPALFAMEYALFQLWKSWGIQPDVVIGHSVGEYVAACVAGIFTLEDGLKLIAHRGRLMQQLTEVGEMVAVMASAAQIQAIINPYTDQVAIAAYNTTNSIVISGAKAAIRDICSQLAALGIKTKNLQVSHAFHSPLMAPMLAEFADIAEQITYNQPQIPLISNLTGKPATAEITTPQYWVNHISQPVKFAESIATLHQLGYKIFLEIGPKPILLGMVHQCIPEGEHLSLPSLYPKLEDSQQLLQSLATLYIHGVPINWDEFYQDSSNRTKIALPTYPFQRQRYWIKRNQGVEDKFTNTRSNQGNKRHPILGYRLPDLAALPHTYIWETVVDEFYLAWLKDHQVWDTVIMPHTGYLQIAFEATQEAFNQPCSQISNLKLYFPLFLSKEEEQKIQVILSPKSPSQMLLQIYSCRLSTSSSPPEWTLYADAQVSSSTTYPEQTEHLRRLTEV
ncbi:type I polyketide synthase [Cylindrospermum sp. FACHB-282]|uniref:type I polyketide synthase n=1 Tax=Cylindrospermum sp. FACHB-282 TaxID=2692794 RepID=UPI0016829635|nr:type I polyketide synthase [Cylindrospermum sp. FACHB-282]MBD2385059.1 type I polyketide synthase [Cylindrospermum sp. FACHB-282]